MNLMQAVDAWLAEDRANGRIRSEHTLRAYRYTLTQLKEDVDNRDPRLIGKADVQRCLARWGHCKPATRAKQHAALNSFFTWMVFNDIRTSNPAKAIRSTKVPEPEVKRITRDEALILLDYPYEYHRMQWAIHLGLLAGIRRSEFCTLRKRDLARDGYIRVIGKGAKVRWVPVAPELTPVIAGILERVEGPEHHVFCTRERTDGRHRGAFVDDPSTPCDPKTIHNLVSEAGTLVGLAVDLSPHVLRRAFIEVALHEGGQMVAQATAGHKSFDTTLHYAGGVSLDYLSAHMQDVRYRPLSPRSREESPDAQ